MALPAYEELVADELPSYESLTQEEQLPSYDELTAPQMPPEVRDEAMRATAGAMQAWEINTMPYKLDWSGANEQKRARAMVERDAAEREIADITQREGEAGGVALAEIGPDSQPIVYKDEVLRRLGEANADIERYAPKKPTIPSYSEFTKGGGTLEQYGEKFGVIPPAREYLEGEVAAGRKPSPGFWETMASRFTSSIAAGGAEVARSLAPSLGTEGVAQDLQSTAAENQIVSQLNQNASGDLGRGAGNVLGLFAGNPAGSAGVLTGALRASADARSQVLANGGSQGEADKAGMDTFLHMAAYMGTGMAAGKLGANMAGEGASAMRQGVMAGTAATGANIGTSLAMSGGDYGLENLTQDVLFGGMAGLHSYKGAREITQADRRETSEVAAADYANQWQQTMKPLTPEESARVATEGIDSLSTDGLRTNIPADPQDPKSFRVPPAPVSLGGSGAEGAKPRVELPPEQATKLFVDSADTAGEKARRASIAKEIDAPLLAPDPFPVIEPEGPRMVPPGNPEAGALFPRGARTPPVQPIGRPPSGARNFLEIPLFRKGGLTEGASLVLRNRQQNPIGKHLGKATDRQYQVEDELMGRLWREMDTAVGHMNEKRKVAAFKEVEHYTREKENKRPLPKLSADAQRIQDAWENIAEFTGLLAQARGVKVAAPGGYRPMRLIGREYVPRMFAPDFLRAIRNPKKHAAEFNNYVNELAAMQNITTQEAAAALGDLAGGKGRYSSNDFLGNIEVARRERLPESFYDYDMRRVISNYITKYAHRMGQIVAYGQRLEGPHGPVQKNLWDLARDEVRGGDKTTARWLAEAEAQSGGERMLNAGQLLMGRLQTLATGLLLSNPISTVPRNLLGGMVNTAELLGTRRAISSAAHTITSAQARLNAKQAGVVKDSMATLLHVDQLPEDSPVRQFADLMLKASGYNASENWVRTTNFLAADSFAREAATEMAARPNSPLARQMAGLIERMKIKPDDIIAEGGNWQTGQQTRRFIREIVSQQQGGYRFNQVPLWAGSPMGRFFYQFGRWGTQRSQNLWNNVFMPALVGTESTINGVKMRVRDFKPLVRFGLGMVALGEAYALLPQLLLDKDRKDASLTEIGVKMSEDKIKAAEMLTSRAINDVVMSGALGIWNQPVDFYKAWKDQSRFKNPADPPGGSAIRAALQLSQDYIQQGTITGDDWRRFAQAFLPGAVAVEDLGRNIVDEPSYEADNDQRTLRNAGLRFAKDTGMDIQARPGGAQGKTENTPTFVAIRNALMVGDSAKAKELAVNSGMPMKNIRQSVLGRQPFRVGPYTREEVQQNFYQWAQKNLSAGDLEQVQRVQARYERAARAADLW